MSLGTKSGTAETPARAAIRQSRSMVGVRVLPSAVDSVDSVDIVDSDGAAATQ